MDQFIRRQFPRLEFRLFGPDTIWISSQTLYFSQKELHRNLLFFLASQLDWPESLIRIDYKKDLDFTGITCNVDRVSFENRQVLRSGGICNMTLRLFHDTVCLASYRLPVFLTLLDHYLTVKEPVQPGIGIMEDLLIQKELPRKSGSRKPLKTAQALQGAISRRLLKPGNVLYEQDFDFPIMVKKNQNIVITYQINDIQLTATVQALRDGKLWQTIQALNPSSQQEIQVKITGAGKGEVIL